MAFPQMTALITADVGRLLKGIDIPPCPQVLAALLDEVRRPAPNPSRVAALISQDVALAAGVMKIANSALFTPAREVNTVAEALSFLGLGAVFRTVVGELLRTALASGDRARLERFWDSAAHAAAVCAQLATALPGTTRDAAYGFGLFRDCGIPVLLRRFDDYQDTLQLANADPRHSFTFVEEARHATHHAAIGCLMARNWGLADAVSQAILCHHDYSVLENGAGLPRESLVLIAISVVAEQVVALHLRQQHDVEWEKGRYLAADFLGLSQAGLRDLVDDLIYQLDTRRIAA